MHDLEPWIVGLLNPEYKSVCTSILKQGVKLHDPKPRSVGLQDPGQVMSLGATWQDTTCSPHNVQCAEYSVWCKCTL